MHFLGIAEGTDTDVKLPAGQLVIGEEAFAGCEDLKQVIFDPGSVVTEIKCRAFWDSGLESFVAPPSLRRIGALAFRECHSFKTLELNDDIQELGWFCLWRTGITDLHLPSRVKMAREQLGLDQEDPTVLCLPKGLEVVGDSWFIISDIEKLIIPNTVRELGDTAFANCGELREVVFEPGSRLESIEKFCFSNCGIECMTIPKSVTVIGANAFYYCKCLRSLKFEERSQLKHVGEGALAYTPLENRKGLFPSTARVGTK